MSVAEIKRFAADLKSNEALRAEAEKARAGMSHATPMDRVAACAARKGYAFTADEAREHTKATAKAAGKELTDAELDGVVGGTLSPEQQAMIELDQAGRAKDVAMAENQAQQSMFDALSIDSQAKSAAIERAARGVK